MFLDLPEIDIAPKTIGDTDRVLGHPVRNAAETVSDTLCNRCRKTVSASQGGGQPEELGAPTAFGLPGSRRVAHPFEIGVRRSLMSLVWAGGWRPVFCAALPSRRGAHGTNLW